MGEQNPIIGYHVVNERYEVINRRGTKEDPAFGSRVRALAGAERYGRRGEVKEVVALHLYGLLGVIGNEEGDVQLDGMAAKRLVEVCRAQQRKVWPLAVDVDEQEAVYSSRAMLRGPREAGGRR